MSFFLIHQATWYHKITENLFNASWWLFFVFSEKIVDFLKFFFDKVISISLSIWSLAMIRFRCIVSDAEVRFAFMWKVFLIYSCN